MNRFLNTIPSGQNPSLADSDRSRSVKQRPIKSPVGSSTTSQDCHRSGDGCTSSPRACPTKVKFISRWSYPSSKHPYNNDPHWHLGCQRGCVTLPSLAGVVCQFCPGGYGELSGALFSGLVREGLRTPCLEGEGTSSLNCRRLHGGSVFLPGSRPLNVGRV